MGTDRIKRIAVFASGNGSNAENIIRYFRSRPQAGEVVLVVTNRTDAGVVGKARELATEVIVISRETLHDPARMTGLLDSRGVDLVVLAGFLLMIPKYLVERYRMINLHPSLLPRHGGKGMYGRNVHEAVLASGDRITGITVHDVTEHFDEGRIRFQATVEVSPGDTAADIENRIHKLELEHFPRVIEEILAGV